MKVELNSREIELLLMLVHDAASEDFEFEAAPVFSIEELALVDKLEAALKKERNLELETNDLRSSTLQH